ncbi:MAG: radical SAM protein [Candidatus Cloacimonetes bacterium]|nr:radical SAM protein [Candidatus Cloacimonadota bacterium]
MKSVRGFNKMLFILYLKLYVGVSVIIGFRRKRSVGQLITILKRLNYFIDRIRHNKFIHTAKGVRLNLYIPAFPSRAFFTSCAKFAVFGEKLPATTALVSITSACPYSCKHCYQKLDTGPDIDIEFLKSAVANLQDKGIAFFNIEGGEPFLRFDRLLALCEVIDSRSEIWINSTGHGITRERLLQLKATELTAIMFSLHFHEPQQLNSFMGSDNAWSTMENAIALCHEQGIPVAFNACLGRADFYNGNFEKIMQTAYMFGGSIIQLIKPKPSGGWLADGVEEFTLADVKLIAEKVELYNCHRLFSGYPAISPQILEEAPEMFGCTAGGTDRFYINAKGDVQPCEFLNISFGNLQEGDFNSIYSRMRAVFDTPGDCILCEKYSKKIHDVFLRNQLTVLPLDKVLSEKIYQDWDRGRPTRLYWMVEKVLEYSGGKQGPE